DPDAAPPRVQDRYGLAGRRRRAARGGGDPRRARPWWVAHRRLRNGHRHQPLPAVRSARLVGAPHHPRGSDRDMSTTDIPVDVDVLREEIRKTYTDVSTEHEQEFIFP